NSNRASRRGFGSVPWLRLLLSPSGTSSRPRASSGQRRAPATSCGRDEEVETLDESASAGRKRDERHKTDDVSLVAAGGAAAAAEGRWGVGLDHGLPNCVPVESSFISDLPVAFSLWERMRRQHGAS